MTFFGRRGPTQPQLPTTGHAGDDQLLAQIAARSDIDASRNWVHYLYVADEAQARSAAEVVSAAGWQIQRVDGAAGAAAG